MEPKSSLPHSQEPVTQASVNVSQHSVFYDKELLAHRPTPKLEDQPLSAVRDCFFNIFAATLHMIGRSTIRNLRMCHVMVTGTHLSWLKEILSKYIFLYIRAYRPN